MEAEVLEQVWAFQALQQLPRISFVRTDRMQILLRYSRPQEEVTKEGATTGRKQDPDVSSRHR